MVKKPITILKEKEIIPYYCFRFKLKINGIEFRNIKIG
jgi:hypothetical protein